MGLLSQMMRRPFTAAAAIGVAALSAHTATVTINRMSESQILRVDDIDLVFPSILFAHATPKLSFPNTADYYFLVKSSDFSTSKSVKKFILHLPQISFSKIFNPSSVPYTFFSLEKINFLTIPNLLHPWRSVALKNSLYSNVSSLPTHLHFLRTVTSSQPLKSTILTSPSASLPESLYKWHLPQLNDSEIVGNSDCLAEKSQTAVVLLGWLGAKQRHLQRYADWYSSQGFHVVTFTFPLSDILSYGVGGKSEKNVVLLANHLANWVGEAQGKKLIFHTFSNTGWLIYGVILEKFLRRDPTLVESINGCIIDSAPVAYPDPQVWALGFSAAVLKKQSIATKKMSHSIVHHGEHVGVLDEGHALTELKPAVAEAVLLLILEKVFEIVLNLPSVSRRLTEVLTLLTSEQPKCPQLYIYSSADRVIPAKHVELFVERQRRAGHEVRACNFITSPHVDHFRSSPELYTSQLTAFLEDCVLHTCKGFSSS